jgi:hypothetical protein
LPFSASRRLAGGIRRSSRVRALLSMRSLRLATFWMPLGKRRDNWPSHILSVSLSLKLAITRRL